MGIGIYIHIPFCVKKCKYCDFLSFSTKEWESEYIRHLVLEMQQWKEVVSAHVVDTIFIGGGTPSVLSLTNMERMLLGICDMLSNRPVAEFTVECNPGTVDEERLLLMKQYGVNRLSFGIQSAVDQELQNLGRIHAFSEAKESYDLARRCGFENINLDLMSAIPGQTLASYGHTLDEILGLSPEHISSYSLIIEEGTPFYKLYQDQPPVDEDTDRLMYELTKEKLAEYGYQRYEISNYAKQGYACRHNLKYWRGEDYLGLGLGASSLWQGKRFSNERDPKAYFSRIRNGGPAHGEEEILSPEDKMAEFIFLGLRCMKGISIAAFQERFGHSLEEIYGEVIHKHMKNGLLERKNDSIYLTERGIDVSNYVFADFL